MVRDINQARIFLRRQQLSKKHYRLPKWVPQWIQRRVEVNVFHLYRFMENAGKQLPADALVLDAGAGEGRFFEEFSHTKYIGVDLAIGDVAWNYRGLDVIGNLVAQPFASNTFDAVLCTQVLEHVTEPKNVLSEIYRLLKPGGRLFLSAPQSWHQHQKPYDFYRYTSFGLTYLLEQVGLEIEILQPMGGYFWFLSFQLQNINYWLFPKSMKHRIWTCPLRALNGLVFQIIIPLILFYLDRFDKTKDETFGYICMARKK